MTDDIWQRLSVIEKINYIVGAITVFLILIIGSIGLVVWIPYYLGRFL